MLPCIFTHYIHGRQQCWDFLFPHRFAYFACFGKLVDALFRLKWSTSFSSDSHSIFIFVKFGIYTITTGNWFINLHEISFLANTLIMWMLVWAKLNRFRNCVKSLIPSTWNQSQFDVSKVQIQNSFYKSIHSPQKFDGEPVEKFYQADGIRRNNQPFHPLTRLRNWIQVG